MDATLSSFADVTAAIGAARDIRVGSYVLPHGAMRSALEAAAQRGARVSVTLQARPYNDAQHALRRENAAAARELRAAGAVVHLSEGSRTRGFHLKAAVCDGVAYLDDRNWGTSAGTIVRDDAAPDVALVRAALRGHGGDDGVLATRKDAAIRGETAFIDGSGDAPLYVESESFGPGPIASALLRHAARGAQTTIVVDGHALDERGRAELARLQHAGIGVYTNGAGEKRALAGAAVWVGSANATGVWADRGDQIDWGTVSRDPALVEQVRSQAERYGAGVAAGVTG